ncbi:transmembrane protein 209 [Lamellibrachia satsuma]|nr:transmembrane protein 209 [Lamellibrachia satsuma]
MKRLGRAESPVVEKTLARRQALVAARDAILWAFINIVLMAIMYFEMNYKMVLCYFDLVHPFFWYAECFLTLLFACNAIIDLVNYLIPTIASTVVELSAKQKQLLAVSSSDQGFQTTTQRKMSPDPKSGLSFSPSSFTGQTNFVTTSSPVYAASHYIPYNTPASHFSSPGHSFGNLSSFHWSSPDSPTISPGGYYFRQSPGTPPMGQSFIGAGPTSFVKSPSFPGQHLASYSNLSSSQSGSFNRSSSPLTPTNNLSPLFHDPADVSSLRNRLQTSFNRTSPLKPEEAITSQQSLSQFLKEKEEAEMRSQLGTTEALPSAGTSFWNFNRTISDYTPMHRKYLYQVASRSAQSNKLKDEDNDDGAAYGYGDECLLKSGVPVTDIDDWVENIRKWISQTVLNRLIKEINTINDVLRRIGSEDMQIGEVSVSTLKQLALTKATHIPSLSNIIPFLEVSSNQEYVVARIRELASGGCMSSYTWNKGGKYKKKAWTEELPTDAALVMHMLCSYMDFRLPPHPLYPDGKTFTCQHFLKTPEKPNLSKKDSLCIYQTCINPPHYKVVIGSEVFHVQRGRNNMFHAVLLFLVHIKVKEHGMLGRVNLGMSGVNILWVLGDD